ncbi:MAG: site-specific integrase [Bacteroidaceae bacterium]|nr:site-specific integrase [Bacteroidaceae bacterium]
MRATFKILFYIKRGSGKHEECPIMGRLTINGTIAQFSCKCTVPESLWDAKGNCALGKSRKAKEVNQTLDELRMQLIRHYQRLLEHSGFVTAEMVRNAFQGIGSGNDTLLGVFDKENGLFLSRCGKDRAYSSYKVFVRGRNYVADFLRARYRRKDIFLSELTPDFIKEFSIYLLTDRNLRQTTVWMACMQLKGIIARAHENGLILRNPFAQFHIRPDVEERAYLTQEELKRLMTVEFDDPSLTFCRDVFVFASFTALSFVDIRELTTDDIRLINGEKWIVSKRQKTRVPYTVKLLDIPLHIIDRYSPNRTDSHIFPNLNYWTMCKRLKKVITLCDIRKPISWHCARHTFATLALSNNMPIESISRILGHTKISTTQIYAKITTEKLNTDITAFGEKLSISFEDDK